MKILNLGCGTDKEGLGIDIDSNSNPDIVADICKPLPIKDKFNVVQAIEVMEHVYNPRALIKNMLKHLNKDGIGTITTPNALGYEISYRFRGKKKINSSVQQYLTPCVIKGLINRCGGRVIYQNIGSRFWLKHINIRFKSIIQGK